MLASNDNGFCDIISLSSPNPRVVSQVWGFDLNSRHLKEGLHECYMVHSNQRYIVQWKSQPDCKRTGTQIVMEVIEMETERFARMKFTVNKSF